MNDWIILVIPIVGLVALLIALPLARRCMPLARIEPSPELDPPSPEQIAREAASAMGQAVTAVMREERRRGRVEGMTIANVVHSMEQRDFSPPAGFMRPAPMMPAGEELDQLISSMRRRENA